MQRSLSALLSPYQGQRLRTVPHKALDESVATLRLSAEHSASISSASFPITSRRPCRPILSWACGSWTAEQGHSNVQGTYAVLAAPTARIAVLAEGPTSSCLR
ncbi:hypothetical protein CVIRNUC_002294 [Coccomyxa viridis]|uniref:Uncharacterized protein n=1 Tax=Coccomyxa viridis TaxID=1274662 RepID=A0AAV1HX96_9CHLO|nr:hypothetical protein CVIRNUC_002294 [Coccomyxa viridis]